MFSTDLGGNAFDKAANQHEQVLENRQDMLKEGECFEELYQSKISSGLTHNDAVDFALSKTTGYFKSAGKAIDFDFTTNKCVFGERSRGHQRGRLVYIGVYRAKTWTCKPILEMQKVQAILEKHQVPYISEFIKGILSTQPAGYRAFGAVITYVENVGFSDLARELRGEYQESNQRGAIL